jgi:hypothetical protein
LTAFKKYYTESGDTIPDYESLCDPVDFEWPLWLQIPLDMHSSPEVFA